MQNQNGIQLMIESAQTPASEYSNSKPLPIAKIPTSPSLVRESPDTINIQDDDPVAGTGVFAHSCEDMIPYHQLLSRFYLQQDFYPSLNTYCKTMKTLLKPHIVPIGNKKTILANFSEISRGFAKHERNKHHLGLYIFKQLGTTGALHPKDVLVMKGRFKQPQIERVMNSYEKTYVSCSKCDSYDVRLWKGDRRGWFITCPNCNVEYPVPGVNFACTLRVSRRIQKAPQEPDKETKTEAKPVIIQDREIMISRKPDIKSKL